MNSDTVPTKKPKRGKALLTVGAVVLLLVWLGSCLRSDPEITTVSTAPGNPLPANVETHTVALTQHAPRIAVAGTAESEERIRLSARVSAYVHKVLASAGNAVTNGQVLVLLDDRELKQQMSAAEARFKQSEIEFRRAEKLMATGATTAQAFTSANSAFQAAQAELQRIQVMLTDTRIVSPISGLVTDRSVEVGDLVSPGEVFMSVYDPLRMRLAAPVPTRLLERLALGKDLEITLDRPSLTLKGTVAEIVSEVEPRSRTQMVKVSLDAKGQSILPGTYGRLWVEEEARPAILVPLTAVQSVGQLKTVQLVRGDRVLRRLVRTGSADGGLIEVLSGLEPGHVILTHPGQTAR